MALGAENSNSKETRNQVFDSKFELIEAIGRGRNSIVYRAKKIGQNSPEIAIKILPIRNNQEECVARMKREALVMLSSVNQNIVKLHDFVSKPEYCYITMELADSGDLRTLLGKRNSALALDLAIDFTVQILRGLELIHKKGILHRDIKPENILLINNHIVKIADFSVARLPIENVDLNQSQAIGTFDYIAPEILNGSECNIKSDLYSVGITFYQLLTNKLPFQAKSLAEQINAKVEGSYKPATEINQELPWQIDQIVEKAINSDPEKRYNNASEFIFDLESLRNQRHDSQINRVVTFENYDDRKLLNNWIINEVKDQPEEEEIIEEALEEDNSEQFAENLVNDEELKEEKSRKRARNTKFISKMIISANIIIGILVGVSYASSKYKKAKSLSKNITSTDVAGYSNNLTNNNSYLNNLEKIFKTPINGILEKINLDGSDIKFATMPIEGEKDKIMVQLSLIKWEPVVIDLREMAEGKSVVIDQLGLKIKLELDGNKSVEGKSFGKYTEINSKRVGKILIDL